MTDRDRARILAEIVEMSGMRNPPENSIGLKDFAESTGCSFATAKRRLQVLMDAGQLKGAKFLLDGRSQWRFWKADP